MKRSDTIQAATDRDPNPKPPPKVTLNSYANPQREMATNPNPSLGEVGVVDGSDDPTIDTGDDVDTTTEDRLRPRDHIS
jgi:hypothetical protein